MPAMESRIGTEFSLSNAFGHLENPLPNLVFGYAIGFRSAVVFEVVEGHPVNRMPFQSGGEAIQPDLNAVHCIEGAFGSARLVVEHKHPAALNQVISFEAPLDHYILDGESEPLFGGYH